MGQEFYFGMICGVEIDLFRMTLFKDATMQQVVYWNGDQNH